MQGWPKYDEELIIQAIKEVSIVCSYKKERKFMEVGVIKHLQSPENTAIFCTSVGQKQNIITDSFPNRNQGTISCPRINRFIPNRNQGSIFVYIFLRGQLFFVFLKCHDLRAMAMKLLNRKAEGVS